MNDWLVCTWHQGACTLVPTAKLDAILAQLGMFGLVFIAVAIVVAVLYTIVGVFQIEHQRIKSPINHVLQYHGPIPGSDDEKDNDL